ncbi:PREDICTED: uncharacterized protein LOC104799749 [Tarenaya hassleriana]|uniref:uncharacterized protein LOC104799749 n=1 Tax=Tarenaya hassleriana TaxID=28532 RepID=UPI00053C3A1B|nr:PREDICTED: uncharacterized protein LOC104799749 [Tarenaya hassleriana]
MEEKEPPKASILHRRNGVVSQPLDLELISIITNSKTSPPPLPSYTSLKDVLPFSTAASVNSPSSSAAVNFPSAVGISIRNRLVKQAAAAYLTPSTPNPSAAPSLFRRFSSAVLRIFSAVLDSFLSLFPYPRKIFRS